MKTKSKRKPVRPKTKLGLPDLERAKAAVVGSLPSPGFQVRVRSQNRRICRVVLLRAAPFFQQDCGRSFSNVS